MFGFVGNWAATGKEHPCFQLMSATELFEWNGFQNYQVQLCSITVAQKIDRLDCILGKFSFASFLQSCPEIKCNLFPAPPLFSGASKHTHAAIVEIFK